MHSQKDSPIELTEASPILLILIQPHWTYLSFLQIADFVFKNSYNLSYWWIIRSLRGGWFFRLGIRSRRHPSQATTFPDSVWWWFVEENFLSIHPTKLQSNYRSFNCKEWRETISNFNLLCWCPWSSADCLWILLSYMLGTYTTKVGNSHVIVQCIEEYINTESPVSLSTEIIILLKKNDISSCILFFLARL